MSVHVEMTADAHRLHRENAKLQGDLVKVKQELKEIKRGMRGVGEEHSRAAKSAQEAFDPKRIAGFVGALTGVGGVTGAIGMIVRAQDQWIRKQAEIARLTKETLDNSVAFLALQPEGTQARRFQQAGTSAALAGITDRPLAYNTVQALQSAIAAKQPDLGEQEAFEAGLRAARTVFAATQVGVPLEFGREAEVFGAGLGMKPGQLLRMLYVAGQASSRDPAALARAAPALREFDDKYFGVAAASVLAGSFKAEQLETYTKAAGIGLSRTAGTDQFQARLAMLGVADATRLEKLRALAKAGLDTPEELTLAGLTEMRQAGAVAALVQQLAGVEQNIEKIRQGAVPGLFPGQRAAVEGAVPKTAVSRVLDVAEASAGIIEQTGPVATRGMLDTLERRFRYSAAITAGIDRNMFGAPISDDAELSWGEMWLLRRTTNDELQRLFDVQYAEFKRERREFESGAQTPQEFARDITALYQIMLDVKQRQDELRPGGLSFSEVQELIDLFRSAVQTHQRAAEQQLEAARGGPNLMPKGNRDI